jgi:hypothetical protein
MMRGGDCYSYGGWIDSTNNSREIATISELPRACITVVSPTIPCQPAEFGRTNGTLLPSPFHWHRAILAGRALLLVLLNLFSCFLVARVVILKPRIDVLEFDLAIECHTETIEIFHIDNHIS